MSSGAPVREYTEALALAGRGGDEGFEVSVADGSRIIGAAGPDLAVQANANQVLDEADQAYAGFLTAARQFISSHGMEERLDPDEPEERTLPGVEEVNGPVLRRACGRRIPGRSYGSLRHVSAMTTGPAGLILRRTRTNNPATAFRRRIAGRRQAASPEVPLRLGGAGIA
ncbi:hypothetical protein QFZ65_001900 [Arthrobacter sp. B3I9]|nr:hypothetical protein [Arthrobacter sp. B3I9]